MEQRTTTIVETFRALSAQKKITVFGIALAVLALPVFLIGARLQHNTQQHASGTQGTAVLSLEPNTQAVKQGQTITEDVYLDPGKDKASFVNLHLQYDPTKLKLLSFVPSAPFTILSKGQPPTSTPTDTPSPPTSSPTPPTPCVPAPSCLFEHPMCEISQPAGGWCAPSITPIPSPPPGCFYQFSNICPGQYCNPANPNCHPVGCGKILVCPPTPSGTPPTCIPRPSCLDSTPRCLISEPLPGWCPATPTPTPIRCGGNIQNPQQCPAGYACQPDPAHPELPFGDVGGFCMKTVLGANTTSGDISYGLGIGASQANAISKKTKVARITFQTLGSTDTNGAKVTFANGNVVLALTTDNPSSNILQATQDATITIQSTAASKVSLTSLTPNRGPVGTVITIHGTGFTATGNSVRFDSAYSMSYSSSDGTMITYTIPTSSGPCSGPQGPCNITGVKILPGVHSIAVYNTNGSSNTLTFTVIAKPGTAVIQSIVPTHAKTGTRVTIYGRNFVGNHGDQIVFDLTHADFVQQGLVPDSNITSDGITAITFTVPDHLSVGCGIASPASCAQILQPGKYPVSIVNANGSSNNVSLTVDAGPGTPSPTPQPGSTVLNFTLTLNAFDQSVQPLHPDKKLLVEVFDKNNKKIGTTAGGVISYTAPSSGVFQGAIDITGISYTQNASYVVKVTSPGYLRRQIPGIQQFHAGSNAMPSATLTAGDINGDNIINILDYNIISDCFGDKSTSAACLSHTVHDNADLNDNGVIDGVDYNIFLRSLQTQHGD